MINQKMRKLLTIEGIYQLKAHVNRLYIKRQNGGCGFVELESTYNAAIVGLNDYIKQGKDRLTRLVQEYDAGKTKYSLQKEATLIKQKYLTQETAAQNIKNHLKVQHWKWEDRRTHPSIHPWRYSPFWALASLIRCLHSSLFAALLLHPLIPSSCRASLWTTSARLVPGIPTGLVIWKFPFKTLFGILCSSILIICPTHPSLLNLMSSTMFGSLYKL